MSTPMPRLPKTITAPVSQARRGRAERARGRSVRRAGHRRGAVAVRGDVRASRLSGCATTTGPTAARPDRAPPVLLVPPLMLAAEIYDVSPATSAVTILRRARRRPLGGRLRGARARAGRARAHARRPRAGGLRGGRPRAGADRPRRPPRRLFAGRDVLLPDRRVPAQRGPGLADHVRQPGRHAARDAVRAARAARGRGGRGCSPTACSAAAALPAWASRTGFRLLDPVKSLRNRIEFISQLHDREALLPREGQRRFLEADGWVAWPGPAMAEFLRQFIAHNRMLEGGFVIEDRLLTLADIGLPDPVRGRHRRRDRAGGRACGRSDRPRRAPTSTSSRSAPATSGSSSARRPTSVTWPTVAGWARWRAGEGELPEHDRARSPTTPRSSSARRSATASGYGVELAGAASERASPARSSAPPAGRSAACAS